ncbi:hypothetical protein EVAR_18334_1 [Eumeta japonica]|uniref:Uncharacterized protein n=1 Tax=Eumeta variegata TaxID=151549 RepID=A0A4C1V950_EUMVA|nr:hypothetical protein EVAR_18334_1 [Eumeta japonica]
MLSHRLPAGADNAPARRRAIGGRGGEGAGGVSGATRGGDEEYYRPLKPYIGVKPDVTRSVTAFVGRAYPALHQHGEFKVRAIRFEMKEKIAEGRPSAVP